MIKRSLLLFVFAGIPFAHSFNQIVTSFGMNAGLVYSGIWKPEKQQDLMPTGYKAGFSLFVTSEIKLNRVLSLRPEFGYIRKGYKNKIEILFTDGTSGNAKNKNVIFHKMALDARLKVAPFRSKFSPYIIPGIRLDYMVAVKDIEITEEASGQTFFLFELHAGEIRKWNLGLISGIGLEYKNKIYLEFDYNQSEINLTKKSSLVANEECWSFRIGIHFKCK